MSVLIKGMDKETAVRICAYTGVRMDDSDFVPVPPHGRLIDADELFPFYADLLDGRDVQLVIPKIIIDTAPTIIEAEPPKEEAECSK